MNFSEWRQDKRYTQERKIIGRALVIIVGFSLIFTILMWMRPPLEKSPPPSRPGGAVPSTYGYVPPVKSELERAAELVTAGKVKEAKVILDAEEIVFWRLRGAIAWRNGELPEALACFQRAVVISPRSAIDLGNLAQVQLLQKDLPGAVASLRAAHEADFQDIFITNRLLLARIEAGETDRVASEVAQFLEESPDKSLASVGLASAALALKKGDTAKAVEFIESARTRLPQDTFQSLMLATPLFSHASEPALARYYVNATPEPGR